MKVYAKQQLQDSFNISPIQKRKCRGASANLTPEATTTFESENFDEMLFQQFSESSS